MIHRPYLCCAFLLSLISVGSCQVADDSRHSDRPPNILLVVVDDLGFNDLGIYGSEIRTPTIDALASDGIILGNFHVAPNCSPTRAMLMSGTDSHIAGLGNMAEEYSPNQQGQPGYEGYLNFRVAALPELLQDAGYNTYMTGKWHLGLTGETSPAARGFDKSFALLQGGAGAFSNMLPVVGPGIAMYREDDRNVATLPDDFYSTRFYTERMIDYIDGGLSDDKPFFAYLAYTSPHWPLQAPAESIARYAGQYDAGYDVLISNRLRQVKERGWLDSDVPAFQRMPGERPWNALSADEKRVEARKMEVYAAMVDDLDRYLGMLIDHLKAIDEYDNTIIFFLSDNGPEAHHLERGWDDLGTWVEQCCDNSYENIGKPDSYIWYGPNWGQAGNTPARMFKGFTSQGGVRVPAFVHYPNGIRSTGTSNALLSVKDVMPTLLELAGTQHPGSEHRGREVEPMQGESMVPLFGNSAAPVHDSDYYIGWELFGKRAIRQGDWKIIYEPYHEILEPRPAGIKTDQWQLYNLKEDPAELHDLAAEEPEILAELENLWHEYQQQNGVILPNQASGY